MTQPGIGPITSLAFVLTSVMSRVSNAASKSQATWDRFRESIVLEANSGWERSTSRGTLATQWNSGIAMRRQAGLARDPRAGCKTERVIDAVEDGIFWANQIYEKALLRYGRGNIDFKW